MSIHIVRQRWGRDEAREASRSKTHRPWQKGEELPKSTGESDPGNITSYTGLVPTLWHGPYNYERPSDSL